MLSKRIPTVLIVLLALCLTLAIAVSAFAAPGDSLRRTTTLWGANEVPGPGDPDGSGEAKIQINMKRHQLCYTLVVRRIAPATAAHIHVGDSTVAGPVVVPLGAPTDGRKPRVVRREMRAENGDLLERRILGDQADGCPI